jgi:flagellar protein FliT
MDYYSIRLFFGLSSGFPATRTGNKPKIFRQFPATKPAGAGYHPLMPTPMIALYEEIRALSQRMVSAAQANDWAALIELEQLVATLRDELTDSGEKFSLSTPEMLRKHGLIQQILRDDAEIRRHTEPWMERLRHLLDARQAAGQGGRRKPPRRQADSDNLRH